MNKEQLKRFENSLVNTEDIYHEIAKNYVISMNVKYGSSSIAPLAGLETLSLDDFLCKYCENLTYEDLKLGESILKLFEITN